MRLLLLLVDNAVNIALALLPVNSIFDEYQPTCEDYMPIEIKVTDPAKCDKGELRLVANLLLQLIGDKPANLGTLEITVDASKAVSAVRQAVEQIAADDNPAAGEDVPSPAEVFAGGGNPSEVFAGGAMPSEVFGGNAGGANSAPSTAVADPSLTARAAMPVTSTSASVPLPPAPPPVAAAPTVAAPVPPAPPAPGVELDSAGLPWDGRIHAESKAKIKKDDTWKKRRGVDDATVAAVEAQLRAVLAAPSVAGNAPAAPALVPPPPPPAAASPVAPAPTVPVAAQPAASVAPELGNVPPPPPPANGAPAASTATPIAPAVSPSTGTPAGNAPAPSITFPQLLPKVTLALAQKTLSDERVKQVLEHYKLPSIPSLAMRQDLVQPVHDALFGAA